MRLVIVVGVLVAIVVIVLTYLGLRHWKEMRLLRKDPRILAAQGRLERAAAERVVTMSHQVRQAEQSVTLAIQSLDQVLQDDSAMFLPRALVDQMATARTVLKKQVRTIQKLIN